MMKQTIKGKPVTAPYIAVFDATQKIIGEAIKLDPPATIEMQLVGQQFGFQLYMPAPLTLVLSKPEIVGVAFLGEDKQFLVGFSIPGDPQLRREGEEFVVTSRYIIMSPKKQPS